MDDNNMSRPLLDNDNILLGAEEGNFPHEESGTEGGSPRPPNPIPAWLTERQGPLQDSPGASQGIGSGSLLGRAHDETRPKMKYSRSMRRTANAAARARRQPWIVLDENGHRTFLHSDKRAIIHSIGLHIPIRDMRLLDVNLVGSDCTILVRDNAIIVSMEHVRFIVTADKAIIPREATEQNPLTARFVDMLEDALFDWNKQRREFEAQQEAEAGGTFMSGNSGTLGGTGSNKIGVDQDDTSSVHHELQEPLPLELVVIEAALKEVVSSLSMQIKELEGVALPALDALTKSVSSTNLERVRKVKTRHQRLTLRTEALRDELQRFLQDDDYLSEMCLTRRKELEEAAKQATMSLGDVQGTEGPGSVAASGYFAPSSMTRRGGMALARFHNGHGGSPPQATRTSSGLPSREVLLQMTAGPAAAAAAAAAEEEADAEAQQDVENLLESYYMQVDGLYDKLVSVGEYIKDTEEYINIELDSSRNRLIRFEIVLSVATFAIMPFNLLAGILGENLIIPEQITASVHQFYGVNMAATVFCCLIFYSIVLYMRYSKLL